MLKILFYLAFYSLPGELIFQLKHVIGLSPFLEREKRTDDSKNADDDSNHLSGKSSATIGKVLNRILWNLVLGLCLNSWFLFLISLVNVQLLTPLTLLALDSSCLLFALMLKRKTKANTIFHEISSLLSRSTTRLRKSPLVKGQLARMVTTALFFVLYGKLLFEFSVYFLHNDHSIFIDLYAYLENIRGFLSMQKLPLNFFSFEKYYFMGYDYYLLQYLWVAPEQWEWISSFFLPFFHIFLVFFLISSLIARRFSKYFYFVTILIFLEGYYFPTWIQFVLPNTFNLLLYAMFVETLAFDRKGLVVVAVLTASMFLYSPSTLVAFLIPLSVPYTCLFVSSHWKKDWKIKITIFLAIGVTAVGGLYFWSAFSSTSFMAHRFTWVREHDYLFNDATGYDFKYRFYPMLFRWLASFSAGSFILLWFLKKLVRKIKPNEFALVSFNKKSYAIFISLYTFHVFFFLISLNVYEWNLFTGLPYRFYRYFIFLEFSTYVLSSIFVACIIQSGILATIGVVVGLDRFKMELLRLNPFSRPSLKSRKVTDRGMRVTMVLVVVIGGATLLGVPTLSASQIYAIRKDWAYYKFTYFTPSNISEMSRRIESHLNPGDLMFVSPDALEPRILGTYLVNYAFLDDDTMYSVLSLENYSQIADYLTGSSPKVLSTTHPFNYELNETLRVSAPVDFVILDSRQSSLVEYLQGDIRFQQVDSMYIPPNEYQPERTLYVFSVICGE